MTRTRRRLRQLVTPALTGVLVACQSGDSVIVAGEPGAPLPDLRSHELAQFYAGFSLFEHTYSPAQGLGPLFNENQCSACHTVPASGGSTGFERVVKATRFVPPNRCDQLVTSGGENVRTQATPRLGSHGVERQSIPANATEVGRFTPPFLFGLGLVEMVPESTILRRADPNDSDDDGISGRAGRTRDGRFARFGRKAEFASIHDFVVSALLLEMGLTTPDHLDEGAPEGLPLLSDLDAAPDPDVDQGSVALFTAFVRFLVPPAPASPRSDAHRDSIDAGRRVFRALGCADCHTSAMETGASTIPALDRRTVALYSDLLLHDMGPKLANTCTQAATPTELRTTPLMGLRHRDRLLHDGRTSDLREAILAHGGEAERARDAFARPRWSLQEYLLQFLRSL